MAVATGCNVVSATAALANRLRVCHCSLMGGLTLVLGSCTGAAVRVGCVLGAQASCGLCGLSLVERTC